MILLSTIAYIADDLGLWLKSEGLSIVATAVMQVSFLIGVALITLYFLIRSI